MKTSKLGIIHCLAQCTSFKCDWNESIGDGLSVAQVRSKARYHTNRTGHTTVVETANSTYYEQEKHE